MGLVVPTIFRIGSYRFYFYSHEPNEPPRVHIDKASCSAKFWLKSVSLTHNLGFSKMELNALKQLVIKHQQRLLEGWHEYFGS